MIKTRKWTKRNDRLGPVEKKKSVRSKVGLKCILRGMAEDYFREFS